MRRTHTLAKANLLNASLLAAVLAPSAPGQAVCWNAKDKSTIYQYWDSCGSELWDLQFDVQTSANTFFGPFWAGWALVRGRCRGGFNDCSGNYVGGYPEKGRKYFQYNIAPEEELWASWFITDKYSETMNCLNNPEWFEETLWERTYVTGYSHVYCN